ncbi:response regulator transcription factor [Lysobacter sp. FW306-1B-D06B]|uniref:response regulator transcription factor n=1 Tax=Lysobacter sp. FW306-1B-D06B TaxID=3140250 RepID=UPI00314088A2
MALRIILADDHPVVLFGAGAIINSSGIGTVVAQAANAEQLLQALATHPCDVLVTDFSMPGDRADGVSMLHQIRRQYPDLPILLLSAATNLAVLRSAAAAGVLGIVDKASSLEELPRAILTVLRGASYVSAAHAQRAAEGGDSALAIHQLSPRETEVLRLLAGGLTVSAIAERLHRQVSTVSRQKRDAMRKLGINGDAELFDFIRISGFS